ncbi:MAG: ATPase [Desulfobacterium sp.]|nr:ATPase [Desulfobacterium sp.]
MSQIDLPKIYNPAIQTKQELIDNFVVRTGLFQDILNDIKTSEMKHPEQHYIIQGSRGQGKTTLLLRIAYEIQNDPQLSKRLIPVIFNEEQYNISRLFKLWESIAEYLKESGDMPDLYDQMQNLKYDDDYERRCFELIEKALIVRNQKMIVFIDNIDELFAKFSKQEHHRLREVFIESAELRVIGASSISLEFHNDYGKPFYQFFKMPYLKGLSIDETRNLLLGLGRHYQNDRVKDIVEKQPGRIESLRRLSGGVIRTIIILFEIFVDDENGSAFKDLEKILDSVTPLYKHRMDKLSAQQQEIVDFIALNWDAVSVKDIARKTKMESKAVSAQLGQLEKYSIIEKEKTNTKNYLYRIQERFFNIWYLMRLGRKWDERRVRFVVEFLQIWCDEGDLETRANRHLGLLKQGKNNLAYLYFQKKKNRDEAIELSRKSYEKEKTPDNAHTYSMILLWDNQIEEAVRIAGEFLNDLEFLEKYTQDVIAFMLLLMAKKQYHLALKMFEENPHRFIDRFKPVYYALMFFMKKDFPNEYLKMGGELKETVDEIIASIQQLGNDYQ